MIPDIIKGYRAKLGEKKPLSYRKFALDLSATLQPYARVSHAAVYQWEQGKAAPDYWMLVYLSCLHGWPAEMAREILRLPTNKPDKGEGNERTETSVSPARLAE